MDRIINYIDDRSDDIIKTYQYIEPIIGEFKYMLQHECGINDYKITYDKEFIRIKISDYNVDLNYRIPENVTRCMNIRDILK